MTFSIDSNYLQPIIFLYKWFYNKNYLSNSIKVFMFNVLSIDLHF